jgi:hypothetical protein
VSLKDQKLHLVYFIDSQKSQSFQLSMRSAVIYLSLAALGLAFAIAGSIWSTKNISRSKRLLAENRALRKSLFEYQTRFDGAFASAYPAVSSLPSKTVNSAIISDNLPSSDEELQDAPKIEKNEKLDARQLAFVPAKSTADIKAKVPADAKGKESIEAKQEMARNLSKAEVVQSRNGIKDSSSSSPSLMDRPKLETSKSNEAPKPAEIEKTTQEENLAQVSKMPVGTETSLDSASSNVALNAEEGKTADAGVESNSNVKSTQSPPTVESRPSVPVLSNSTDFPKISNSKIEMRGSNYRVSFELRSTAPNTPTSGKLWALAVLDDGGKTVYRTYPAQINLSQGGKIKSLHGAERYRVSNFTVKFFNINVESLEKATLKSIAIGVSNEKGEYTSYPVPLTSISRDSTASPSGG